MTLVDCVVLAVAFTFLEILQLKRILMNMAPNEFVNPYTSIHVRTCDNLKMTGLDNASDR